jgi:hypothetical protein
MLGWSTVGAVDASKCWAEEAEAYLAALGDRLLAAYALGSLNHGGLSELVSGVDLGVIVRDPPESLAAIRHLEVTVSGADGIEGVPLRYGGLYGYGTPFAEGGEYVKLIRKRRFPLVGDCGGI